MRYLKKTQKIGLHYQKFPIVLESYYDVDWNFILDDSNVTSGYIFSRKGCCLEIQKTGYFSQANDGLINDRTSYC